MIIEEIKTKFVTVEGIRFEVQQSLNLSDIAAIEKVVCAEYGISIEVFRSHYKVAPYSDARFIVWWLLHYLYSQNKKGIGRYFDRHHSAIIIGIRKVNDYIGNNDPVIMPHFRNIVHKLKDTL